MPNRPSLSKADALRDLLVCIEAEAQNAQDALEVWRRCASLIEGHRRLYAAISGGEEAPEFSMTARLERAG